jgi:hypothetical protein
MGVIMSNCMKQVFFISLSLLSILPAHLALAQAPVPGVSPYTEIDKRHGIMTRPNERTHILINMRKYLKGIQAVTEALARDDMPAATEAVRSMGSINLYEVRLMFPNAAAVEFRQLAGEMHRDFDSIARDGQEKKDAKLMLAQIGAIMKKCVHCHDTYRLQDSAHEKF